MAMDKNLLQVGQPKKNFVIFSYSFFPLVGAESFCATRFASALADAGHNVHVVTMDHRVSKNSTVVPQSVYDALVSPALKITRVPAKYPVRGPVWARVRYLTAEWRAVNFSRCIQELRRVLEMTENPILVTRVQPINSLIVSWHCRKLAHKWILHISDPMPSLKYIPAFKNTIRHDSPEISIRGILGWLRNKFEYMWLVRGLAKCDAVSVTCSNAIRFYREAYPKVTNRMPMFVTTHIGDDRLRNIAKIEECGSAARFLGCGKIVLHPGELYRGRGGGPMLKAIDELNIIGIKSMFVQLGPIHDDYAEELERNGNVMVLKSSSSQEAIFATRRADVIFVPDFEGPLEYSPYLMSKFVYQIYEDKPIVVLSKKDSAKHEYATAYPEAGIYWADMDDPGTLIDVLREAMSCDLRTIDRTRIREHFSDRSIAREFVKNVDEIL